MQRVLGQERPCVEQAPHLRFVLAAAVRDAADDLIVEILVQRLVHLLVRGGVALLRERVDRRLVVADAVEIGNRADLVERAAQKQLVGRDAGQIERRRGHQEHFVGRRREVVLAIAAVLEIRINRLARFLEVDHRVANLLHLAPERRLEAGRLQQHAANARIGLRFPEVVHDPADGRRPRAAQVADDVGRRQFREIAADAEHQRRVRRNGRLAAEQQVQEDEAGDRDEQRDSENGEQNGDSAASHASCLL